MIQFTPPPGSEVLFKTRRHWYEIVPETADTIWWCSVLCVLAASLVSLFGSIRFLAILVLVVYPIGAYVKELILWNHELYVVVKMQSGKGRLVKVSGVFNRKQVDDAVGDVGRVQETTMLGRYLGYAKVQVQTATRTYISGRLVPLKLMSAMDAVEKAAAKPKGNENVQQLLVQHLGGWREAGLVDDETAKLAVRKLLMEGM